MHSGFVCKADLGEFPVKNVHQLSSQLVRPQNLKHSIEHPVSIVIVMQEHLGD